MQESENRLKILAVGDDDQSIYQFAGANVEYIRRFQKDYADLSNPKYPTPVNVHHMVENYRSTRHIITVANSIIAQNQDRMKTAYPIKIDALRTHEPAGGVLEELDPETNGKVQIISTESFLNQAYACVDEIKRYLSLSAQHQPEHCCIDACVRGKSVWSEPCATLQTRCGEVAPEAGANTSGSYFMRACETSRS